MPRRYTYLEVKKYIESFDGYKLLSTEYKNNKEHLKIECPEGHRFEMKFNNFQQGRRCHKCSYKAISENRKHSYSFVKKCFEERGYKLLSTEYKNICSKLKVQCPEGHNIEITFKAFHTNGAGCRICYYKKLSDRLRLKYTFVKNYIEYRGYKLLSKEFTGVEQKLILQCPKGHIWKTTFHAFKDANVKCIYCLNDKKNVNRKYTYDEVREIFNREGYKLLSTEYKNNRQKLIAECPEGHKVLTTFHNFNMGNRCAKCHHISLRKYFTEEELKEFKTYKETVYRISERNYKTYCRSINKYNLKRGKYNYHLDHIYPVISGFRNNIQPEIISNPNNLQMLWWKDNLYKSDRVIITKHLLYHIAFLH